MLTKIKKFFIPCEDNDYSPLFLKNKSTLFYGFVVVLTFAIAANFVTILGFLSKIPQLSNISSSLLSELSNERRATHSLNVLVENELLNQAAQLKAEDMATQGYFAHVGPDGRMPWHWLQDVGYVFSYAGENLAVNFSESKDVTLAWMNSPTHKANILKQNYQEIGTGVATGNFSGNEVVFIAQVYAQPFPKLEPSTNEIGQTGLIGLDSANILDAFAFEHQLTNNILFFFLIIVVLALILNIFIKIKVQSMSLIRNGLIIIALILGLILINNNNRTYQSESQIEEPNNIDFSSFEYSTNEIDNEVDVEIENEIEN